jgi:hypothetical protein
VVALRGADWNGFIYYGGLIGRTGRSKQMNHPQWIQWINQILSTFSSIQNSIVYIKNGGKWSRALRYQFCDGLNNECRKITEKRGLVDSDVREIHTHRQEWMCLYEPKQFRHTNHMWACINFSHFVTVASSSAYPEWMLLFSISLPLRRLLDNPTPAQFPSVHFHELFCSIVLIFCVPQALTISRNI